MKPRGEITLTLSAHTQSGVPVVMKSRAKLRTTPKPTKREAASQAAPDIANIRGAGFSTHGVDSLVTVIDPGTARYMRDNWNFERQRKISPINVNRLAEEMRQGRFTPGTQIYVCVLPSGEQVIVNGNHTLEAVHASGTPQVLVVTRKHVKDIDEAGKLYAVFDIHKARTWLDSIKATGMNEGETASRTSKVLAALGVIENRFDQGGANLNGVSRLGRIERAAEYEESATLFFTSIDGASKEGGRFVKRAPIMAVALTTFRYQPSLAMEFWGDFSHDDGLTAGMPERALMNYLRNNRGGGGAAVRKLQTRAAALAWNAKFRGEETAMVKPNAMTSFFLLGTPLSRGTKGEE